MRIRIDGLVLVAIGLIIVMTASLLSDSTGSAAASAIRSETSIENSDSQSTSEADSGVSQMPTSQISAAEIPPISTSDDPEAFAAPYDDYTITQGPHGGWYGHMAIDLAAGKDTPIKSPISGTVTELFVDQWGNPNLVIENDVYRVTLLHGIYSVAVNTPIELGQIIGNESNIGYTTDMQGNLCAGRNCGYHTHLNVFDRRLGENINPLDLLNSSP